MQHIIDMLGYLLLKRNNYQKDNLYLLIFINLLMTHGCATYIIKY